VQIFGVEITLAKKATAQLSPVSGWRDGWRRILEPFSGAWQMNVEETHGTVLCYPTLYACLSRISQDIGKLPFLLKQQEANGVWKTVENPAYSPVLRKPNHYQTAQQFREAWILSLLIHGNTYVLKLRDDRGVVARLFVLDPARVMPLVSDSGDVYYQINYSAAENLLPADYPAGTLTIPAREVIHDRINCFHHQLIGVPPVCAAHWAAVKNLRILRSAADFFGNHAQPGGILTAPAGMDEGDAQRIREYWQANYTGQNAGKVAVIGADMKFTSFATKSADSQMVEQMRYSDEQVCQPFGIPPFIVGIGSIPAGLKADDMMDVYHRSALQARIESMEYLLDEGLKIERPLGVELDTDVLLRMAPEKRGAVMGKLVADGIATPNEGRREFNFPPLEGGDTVYMQQQDYPLDQVRLNTIAPPAPPAVVDDEDDELTDDEMDEAIADEA
jgi:HK97 family phage portal protein